MYDHLLPMVLDAYGVKYLRVYSSQKGYRNEIWPVLTSDRQIANVIFYKREPGILNRVKNADNVSGYLARLGMPTRRRLDDRTIKLQSSNSLVYAGLYNYLPGSTIPWEAYTMEHIKQLGSVMSDMHFYLKDMSISALPSVYDEYDEIINRMVDYFTDITINTVINSKLGLNVRVNRLSCYKKLLYLLKSRPDQQAIHMDFVRGNVLFIRKDISGIIDFEKTASGHTVVDVARTLAFLLVDCKYKTTEKVGKYFLYSGYQKRGKNKNIGDNKIRNHLVEMFLAYDFYKFLRHNPYESLYLNEHFIRTRDILAKRGVIFYK